MSNLAMMYRNFEYAGMTPEHVSYILDNFDNFVNSLPRLNENETDLYFYHSDHFLTMLSTGLGSSSFITDATGISTQHLQYLPFGETFVEQRATANYFTPYKFSAKEKDEETGYGYFGARYLANDFSIWLSVDPMADKYPYLSPYMYCAGNPIKFVDPNGKWFWEAKNIRDARKEKRRSGGELDIWKGHDGKKWASVDYSKSENYKGNSAADVKVFKPEGSSWLEKFKKFDSDLPGGSNGDPGSAQPVTKKDVKATANVGLGMLSAATGGTSTAIPSLVLGINSAIGIGTDDGGTPMGKAIDISFNTNSGENVVNISSILCSGLNYGFGTGTIKKVDDFSKIATHVIGRTTDGISIGQSSGSILNNINKNQPE